MMCLFTTVAAAWIGCSEFKATLEWRRKRGGVNGFLLIHALDTSIKKREKPKDPGGGEEREAGGTLVLLG